MLKYTINKIGNRYSMKINNMILYDVDEYIIRIIKDQKKKLDKVIELLIASEYKQFLINEKGKETIKECWLRYIEQELKEE